MAERDPNYQLAKASKGSDVYQKLSVKREIIMERARELAELTIPSLFPPKGYIEGGDLYTPYQDIGARCVNTMTNKMVATILPPNHSPFRHEIPDALATDLKAEAAAAQQDPQQIIQAIQQALSKREQEVKNRMETTQLRSVITEGLRQAMVGSAFLYRHQELDTPQCHNMDQYVVKRNNKGEPILVILHEQTAYVDLDEEVLALIESETVAGADGGGKERDEWEDTVDIYSIQKLEGKWWYCWQELKSGTIIPGTEAKDPKEAPAMYPVWLVPMFGKNWGRSQVDEYYPAFLAAENYSKAIQEYSLAAAWTLMFTKPGSRTRPKDLKNAKNLDVLVGEASDVTFLRTDKGSDINAAVQQLEAIEKRLGFAFLVGTSIQRQGERVTAEEIRWMMKELDTATGGIYATIGSMFQRVFVNRFIYLMEKKGGGLKPLPKFPGSKNVSIKIITGIDALGRTYDDQVLDDLMGAAAKLFPQAFQAQVNFEEYFKRKAAANAVDPEGLIKSQQQLQQEQQQAHMMEAMKNAAPGVAQEATKGIMAQAQASQQQKPQQGSAQQ